MVKKLPPELLKRIYSSMLALPILCLVIGYGFLPHCIVLLGFLGFLEWAMMGRFSWPVTILGIMIVYYIFSFNIFLALITTILGIIFLSSHTVKIIGFLYLTIAIFNLTHWTSTQPISQVISLIASVFMVDIFAYFGGKYFKGPKLAPKISPNKTISGAICGYLASIATASLCSYTMSLEWSFLFIFSLPILAQVGDLLESAAKRYFNVKDSGKFLPGHGGVLDRIDSFLATAIIQ